MLMSALFGAMLIVHFKTEMSYRARVQLWRPEAERCGVVRSNGNIQRAAEASVDRTRATKRLQLCEAELSPGFGFRKTRLRVFVSQSCYLSQVTLTGLSPFLHWKNKNDGNKCAYIVAWLGSSVSKQILNLKWRCDTWNVCWHFKISQRISNSVNNGVLFLPLDYVVHFVCMCVLREGGAHGKCTCL